MSGFWCGFPLDDQGTHVSVMIRSGTHKEEQTLIETLLRVVMEPKMPFMVKIDPNVTMFGKDQNIPVHLVSFVHPKGIHETLQQFYKETYHVPQGTAAFPDYQPHITVKKEAGAQFVKRALEETEGVVVIRRVALYSWENDGDEPVFEIKV